MLACECSAVDYAMIPPIKLVIDGKTYELSRESYIA